MATIARLIIAMGTDPAGLRRGLAQGVQQIQQFARSANQIGSRSNIFGNLDTPAKRAAESAVRALKQKLAVDMADIQENLNLGIFTPEQAATEGEAAGRAFNDGLRQEIANLSNLQGFTSRIHAGMVGQFLRIGDSAGEAFARGFRRTTEFVRSLGLATRRIGVELTAAVSVPLIAAGAASLHFARDFGRAMANVATLIPGNRQRILELRDSVREVSRETAIRSSELAAGLYQIVSAFGDSAEAAQQLRINAIAAVAGLSTVTEAVNVTSAVTKAYGDTSARAVQQVADLALTTVRLGQTTFPELAGSIGRVAPLAANLGVTMEELFATMATGSGVTGDAAEVATQLRGILQALQAPTETMEALFREMGVTSGQAAVRQFGLANVIRTIAQSAEASGRPLQDYIAQIEGQTLAITLAGAQSETYTQKLEEINRATGASGRAFQEQVAGINAAGFAMDQAANRFRGIATRLGEALGPSVLKIIPSIEKVAGSIAGMIQSFAGLSQPVQQFILGLAAVSIAFGPIIHVAGTLITTLAAVARTLFIARTSGLAFSAVLGIITSPVTATVIAFGALIGIIFTFRREITSIDNAINAWIAGSLANMVRRIPLIGESIAKFLQFLAGPAAVKQAQESGAQLGQDFVDAFKATIASSTPAAPDTPHADMSLNFMRGVGQRLGPPPKIVLIDPKELNAQVQTAVDRLNLAREAGRSIAAPFRDLVQLQSQLNTRLQQGRLTIEDENQLTRALLNTRIALGDAAGTSVDAISSRLRIAIDSLELARQSGDDLARPMQQVQNIINTINGYLTTGVRSLADQNQLTRDLLAGQNALAEAAKPDTRAFEAFSNTVRGALAQLQALKSAAQIDLQVPTSDAGAQLERLLDTQFLLNGAGQEYNRQLVQIRTAYANILGIIQSTRNPTKEQIELANQLGAALREAARIEILRSAPNEIRNLLSQLNMAANSYAESIAAFQLAREASDKSGAKAAQRSAEQFQQEAIRLQKLIANLVSQGGLDPGVGEAVLDRMRELMKSLGIDMSNLNTQTSQWIAKLGEAANKVGAVLQGITGLLDAMGALDDSTRSTLEGLTKIAANITKAASGDPASIIGVLGGIAQTIGGLFGGKSPEEKERDRINRENQAILLRIARGVEAINITSSGAQFQQLRDIFAQINDPTRFLLRDNTGLGNRVGALLAANGLDIEDVKRVAQELGLTFQNTAQFYRDFNNALKQADLTAFSQTFTGQLEKLQRSFQIFNVTDPAEKLRQTIELLSRADVGAPAIREALQGVDLTTEQGILDFQKRIQTLFEQFELLSPEDLGGLSAQQFLDQLATAAGLSQEALDALAKSVNETTKEMLNMPSGFRQARAEFLAQGDTARPIIPPPEIIRQTSAPLDVAQGTVSVEMNTTLGQIRDILATSFPSTADPERTTKSGGNTYMFQIADGAIRLAADGRKPEKQADDLLRSLRIKAHATTGDSNRIGDV